MMNALASLVRKRRLSAVLAIALGVVIFVGLNAAANVWFRTARLDLTENRLYTLSEGTKNVLRELKEPIRLRFFYSAAAATGYPTVRAYAERVRDLLAEYRAVAGDNLVIEEIDPVPYTAAEDEAVALGLQGAATQGGEPVYLGMSATNMADGHETLPFFAIEREPLLEYDLTSMIYRLSQAKKPRLALVTNLPLDTGPGGLLASMQGRSQPFVIYSQLMQIFDVTPLEQDFDVVPSDIDAMLIAHPKALSEKTLYALDQFVMRGGRVIAFVDPISEISQLAGEQSGQPVQGATFRSDLWLLKSWGVNYNPGEVVLDAARAAQVQYGANAGRPVVAYPVWIGLKGADDPKVSDFAADDLATGSLTSVNLASVGHFTQAEGATTSFAPIMRSSEASMIYDAEMLLLQADPDTLMRQIVPSGERYAIAARLSGPLKSAFPDGAPKATPEPGALPGAALGAHIGETADANIIVVADSDIFDDRFWVQPQQQGAQTMAVPIADNLTFIAGAVEQMLGSTDLISLRARATENRPFTVVENLKKEADARFLREEQDLSAAIAETQEKLQQLQQRSPAGGEVAALTPEQQAEIDRFRDELSASRARLRDVQHNLRAGIDRLGARLALINIALVPAILIVAAIALGIVRRRRIAASQAA